jgi:predicted metal-dependent hydrolase
VTKTVTTMIDWLRRNPREAPSLDLGGLSLPVVVRRHASAKRMTLRLSPDGSEVRVTIPQWGRSGDALAFAQARRDWLAAQLTGVARTQPVGDGATIRFRGDEVIVRHVPRAPRRPLLTEGAILLGGPEAALQQRLRRWLEAEARSLCAADLDHYCALVDKSPPRLMLSSAKRRWGSCATNGAIRINWRLVMAPDAVRRSVVAHEVAHLVHFDHSPRFHALLGVLFEGDIKAANQWLKREGRSLYLPFG